MNRRDALRNLVGGAIALALAPVATVRRFAALEPENYIGDARELAALIHKIFEQQIMPSLRRESPLLEIFANDTLRHEYHTEGERWVFAVDVRG